MHRLERPLEPHDFVGLVREEPVIVEIGAYDGYHTNEFFKNFRPQLYFSFEPDHRPLVSGFHKDGRTAWSNYHFRQAAVSDEDGTAQFFFSADSRRNRQYGGSSSLRKPKEHLEHFPWCKFPAVGNVPTVRLDTWREQAFAEHGSFMIDLVWADTQGAENMVIAGGTKALSESVRLFYTEVEEYEMYEGQTNLAGLVQMLPDFRLVGTFESNALFANERLSTKGDFTGWRPK